MFRKLLIGLAILAATAAQVHAAGTIPGISMTQQFDSLGKPLNGGRLYLIQAGTTATPQNCYQDSGLTIAWPNPIMLDSAGRVPQLFCADGSIKVRLTNAAGVQQLVADNLLVVGPSGGGGGGGSVDATTILATGDMKARYGTGSLSGFVRCNGRTIGSATSGATERANADTQSLFEYFWGEDSNLSVSGGRGASANADWVANKALTIPDCRGRSLSGLDDMGNSAAGRLSSTYFGATATTLGAVGGVESKTLATANLPAYTPSGSVSSSFSGFNLPAQHGSGFVGDATGITNGNGGSITSAIAPTGSVTSSFTGAAQGGTSTPFATVGPRILMTVYIKL